MIKELVEIQVPKGYKLVRTEMEKGVLITYEPRFKEGDEVYTFSCDGPIKTILLSIKGDIAYVFDLRNDISMRRLTDIFTTKLELDIASEEVEDITHLYDSARKGRINNFDFMFFDYDTTE